MTIFDRSEEKHSACSHWQYNMHRWSSLHILQPLTKRRVKEQCVETHPISFYRVLTEKTTVFLKKYSCFNNLHRFLPKHVFFYPSVFIKFHSFYLFKHISIAFLPSTFSFAQVSSCYHFSFH